MLITNMKLLNVDVIKWGQKNAENRLYRLGFFLIIFTNLWEFKI